MKTTFIPIRSGSKSISDKNIKLLLGKPLFYWVTKAAFDSGIDNVVISTDSSDYAELAKSLFPSVNIHMRSDETSTDESSTESVILEYLNESKIDGDFILLQVTSPMTTSKDISEAISKYRKDNLSSLVSVVENKRFTWTENTSGEFFPQNYFPKDRPRRQDMYGEFVENGAIYINSVENIIKDKCRISGPNYGFHLMDEDTFFEIDEPSDWDIIENKMKTRNLL